MRDYYEELWERLPDALHPPDLERRSAFLSGHVRPGQRILDLGCGDGAFSELMLGHGAAHVIAADVAEAALARVRARPRLEHPGSGRLETLLVPFDGPLGLEDNVVDLVWASEVLEHVADTARFLSEIRRVLVRGGTLLVTTPNHTRLRLALGGAAAYSPPLGDHLHLYDRTSLSGVLGEFGFAPVRVRAAGRLGGLSGLLLGEAGRP